MNIVTYKGYSAAVEFDADDLLLTGRIAGINDVVGFHAVTAKDLVAAFHEAVDDYLETCVKAGKDPERPYSGKVMLRVDPKVHQRAALAAQLAGMSLNQFGEEALKRAAEQAVPGEALENA
jgi:predicted HicB family RNase H-like nuclease